MNSARAQNYIQRIKVDRLRLWSIGVACVFHLFLVVWPTAADKLPRQHQYQIDLYAWLRSIKLDDVKVTPRPLEWDGTYSSTDQLSTLWIEIWGSRAYLGPSQAIRGRAKWFVLDDGAGAGIEGTGTVRQVRWGNNAAYWYQRNMPLAGGGEGNPYYHDPALARRALIVTAVDMMMLDRLQDQNSFYKKSDFLGGTMNAWVYAFDKCNGVLDRKTRLAFEAGFERSLDKFLSWKARDINTNMDTRAISSAAQLYAATSNPTIRDKAIRVVRLFLFGSENGTLETIDSDVGIFYPAGYVGEADGPETTYNGVSLFHILEARAVNKGDQNWGFLDEVLRRMVLFKVHQYFKDPDNGNGSPFYDGPSGYANRTGDSYVYDQRGRAWRDITAADMYVEARPLVRRRLTDATPSSMVEVIQSGVRGFNTRDSFGDADTSTPEAWGEEHWPPDNPYYSKSGWFDRLKALFDASDPTTLFPFDHPASLNRSFDNEFWAFKGRDSSQDFGFFIENMLNAGRYGSWTGGSLQTFWTKNAGMLVLARHDKTGDEKEEKENTRVWSEIDYWGTEHIWGLDDSVPPRAFTSSTQKNKTSIDYHLDSSPRSVEAVSTFGEETGDEIQGSASYRKAYTAIGNGLQVDITVTSDQSDRVTQLWTTIPVFLREANYESALADTTIEYWTGSAWQPLGTALTSVERIRLGRDFLDGRGTQYGYITFEPAQQIKLSSTIWMQSYQAHGEGGARVHNIHIDLLGSNGAAAPMPAEVSLRYSITTGEAILPPDASIPGPVRNLRIID